MAPEARLQEGTQRAPGLLSQDPYLSLNPATVLQGSPFLPTFAITCFTLDCEPHEVGPPDLFRCPTPCPQHRLQGPGLVQERLVD